MIKKKNKAIRNTLLKNTAVKNEDGELDIDFQITTPEQNDVDVDVEKNTPLVDYEDDIDFHINTADVKDDDDDDDNDDDDVIYIKDVPPPPDNPVNPIHPRDRLKQKVKQIRKRKEKYRVNAKKKAVKYLNKRKAVLLLKDHINKQSVHPPADAETLEPYLIINKNT